jgi:RHS repeat-associated protein
MSKLSANYGLHRVAHVEQRSAGDAAFPRIDIRGSVRAVEDPSGRTLEQREYDAWGGMLGQADANMLGFTGEPQDPDTGLVYLRARWYDPSTGRMLGRDPLPGSMRRPVTQNPYAYALNNPVSLVDPSGRSASGAFPGPRASPTSSSIPLDPFNPFNGLPGMPSIPGVWPPSPIDQVSSSIGGGTAAADAWLKRIEDLYNQADHATSRGPTAVDDWLKAQGWLDEALSPEEARGYARALAQYTDEADTAFKNASKLGHEAGAMEDAWSSAGKIAKYGKIGGGAFDFGTSAWDEWAKDSGMSTGSRIRHAAVKGVATAAGSYGGAAALGGLCATSGVGTAFTFGCGAVGGYVGGKVGGLVGDAVNSIFG